MNNDLKYINEKESTTNKSLASKLQLQTVETLPKYSIHIHQIPKDCIAMLIQAQMPILN